MRTIAIAILFTVSAQAAPLTLVTQGRPGLTLVICNDAVFSHYRGPPDRFVITCDRSNPSWSLTINGCPIHKVTGSSAGGYQFAC